MRAHILTEQQRELLPLIQQFSQEFYLVGGTAIALYVGHRRSIDFDLFTRQEIRRNRIKRIIEQQNIPITTVLYEASDQLHLVVNSVKVTFFQFPYHVDHPVDFEGIIELPTLLDLAAMKAHALGGRAKWKDYVDLYVLLKEQRHV